MQTDWRPNATIMSLAKLEPLRENVVCSIKQKANSLIQFCAAAGLGLHSSEAPHCWHCNVSHFVVNVVHLLLRCGPTVLVDVIGGWDEMNEILMRVSLRVKRGRQHELRPSDAVQSDAYQGEFHSSVSRQTVWLQFESKSNSMMDGHCWQEVGVPSTNQGLKSLCFNYRIGHNQVFLETFQINEYNV